MSHQPAGPATSSTPPASIEVVAIDGVPQVRAGDDLAELLMTALSRQAAQDDGASPLRDGDIVVVTSKVVSKAEGRVVPGDDREQAITDETAQLVAQRGSLRIARTRHGFVMAAAGVDASNTDPGTVVLLPLDPDASARALRERLQALTGLRLAVVVTDTAGRPWREGLVDIALGAAGLLVLDDHRGRTDTAGRTLEATVTAIADQVAGAAELVKGKTSGRAFAVIRGLHDAVSDDHGPGAAALVRRPDDDLFAQGTAEAFAAGRASAVTGRRTIRTWTDDPVPHDVVREIVAAAVTAPAPHGTTPWRFVLLTDLDTRHRLLDAMARQWAADLESDGFDPDAVERRLRRGDLLRQAPALLLPILVDEGRHEYPDERRSTAERDMFVLSTGAAVQNLLVQASARGWAGAWVSSTLFCAPVVRDVLGWPQSWSPMGAVALGRPAADAAHRPPRDIGDFLHIH
jgi:coenzyme F420-0:L-glutamate ligase/coenzyme F420-1:gamma-L-glutamate ligase